MKKILIQKEESVTDVVEKILGVKDGNVVLVVPRGSALAAGMDTFHTLHNEAEKAKKNIFIETVDAKALAMAKAASINAANPFFTGPRRPMSDIVVGGDDAGVSEADEEGGDGAKEEAEEDLDARIVKEFQEPKVRRSRRRMAVVFAAFAAVLGSGVAAATVLPRANIEVVMKKMQWTYADSIEIPVQILSETKSMQKTYAASERRRVEKYAAGTVTIYNTYSSAPQVFVEKTRFETPDKKIFRLQKEVTVPGAKIEEGKIIPSTIAVDVIADKPGDAYNVGPTEKFVIPGLRETKSPKYDGFYAIAEAPMTGGFAGEVWYPSKADLAAARKDMEATLHGALEQITGTTVPAELTLVSSAAKYAVTKEQVIEEPAKEKEFTLLTEAAISVPAYSEADVVTALSRKAGAEIGEGNRLLDHSLEITGMTVDFAHATATASTAFSALFARAVDENTFKERAAGKEEIDLRALVFSLPGVESAKISLWPMWVRRVPANAEKIRISID
ncbi:MAG: hypothetical protein HYS43_00225 [Candidatus Liptonbacteria bacterium]|nr:hypothetical protein [Candidatus Liptonbacteria bacterium]